MPTTTRAVVKEVIPINEYIKEYIILPERYSRYEPGQFLQLAIGEVNSYDIWPDSRAFSIASPCNNQDKIIRLIIKRGASFTVDLLNNLSCGDLVTIRYPLGDFYLDTYLDNMVFIAAGTGITPFLSYIKSSNELSYSGKVYLFHTVKTSNDLIHYKELHEYSQNNDKFVFKVFITREEYDNSSFINRRIDVNQIMDIIDNPLRASYFICGPREFVGDITNQLKKENVEDIHSELWD